MDLNLTERIILGYRSGKFPMGESKTGSIIEWVVPFERGLIPLGGIHCSKSLLKEIKKADFSYVFLFLYYSYCNQQLESMIFRC